MVEEGTESSAGAGNSICFNGFLWVAGTCGVPSVFGRAGAVVAQAGDYTTTLVTEGTNLYFTTARAIAGRAVATAFVTVASSRWIALTISIADLESIPRVCGFRCSVFFGLFIFSIAPMSCLHQKS